MEYLVVMEEEVEAVRKREAALSGGGEVDRKLNGHVRLIGGKETAAICTAEKDWMSDFFAHGMIDR